MLERCQAVEILVSSRFFEQMNFKQMTLLQVHLLKNGNVSSVRTQTKTIFNECAQKLKVTKITKS